MAEYKQHRWDPQELEILVRLRKQAGLSQRDVADFFGMTDYGSVAAWEMGKSKPLVDRRDRFIVYLVNKLLLRRAPEQFQLVWDQVMVGMWEWPTLTLAEWRERFPGRSFVSPVRMTQPGLFLEQSRASDVDLLVRLTHLLADLRIVVERLRAKHPGLVSHGVEVPSGIEPYNN